MDYNTKTRRELYKNNQELVLYNTYVIKNTVNVDYHIHNLLSDPKEYVQHIIDEIKISAYAIVRTHLDSPGFSIYLQNNNLYHISNNLFYLTNLRFGIFNNFDFHIKAMDVNDETLDRTMCLINLNKIAKLIQKLEYSNDLPEAKILVYIGTPKLYLSLSQQGFEYLLNNNNIDFDNKVKLIEMKDKLDSERKL